MRNLRKLKNIHLGKPPLITKKIFLIRLRLSTFVYTRLYSSRLIHNRLDSSSDSSTLVYTCLMTLLLLPTSSALVQTPLVTRLCFQNRSAQSVCIFKQERLFFSNEDKIIMQNDYEEKSWSTHKNLEEPSIQIMGSFLC